MRTPREWTSTRRVGAPPIFYADFVEVHRLFPVEAVRSSHQCRNVPALGRGCARQEARRINCALERAMRLGANEGSTHHEFTRGFRLE